MMVALVKPLHPPQLHYSTTPLAGRMNHVKAKRQTRGGEAQDAGLSLIMSQIKFYYYPGQGRERMKRSASPPSGVPAQHNTHHRAAVVVSRHRHVTKAAAKRRWKLFRREFFPRCVRVFAGASGSYTRYTLRILSVTKGLPERFHSTTGLLSINPVAGWEDPTDELLICCVSLFRA